MKILVLNGGSSTLKAALYGVEDNLPTRKPLWEGSADWGREPGKAHLRFRGDGAAEERDIAIASPSDAFAPLLQGVAQDVAAIGHRIVHGGPKLFEPVRITPEIIAELRRCAEFAPEHNALELQAIETAEKIFGQNVPQVAVFDTAFHKTLPVAAQVYPITFDLYQQGIRRYGFHGISHQYVSQRAAALLGSEPERVVSCHLGNGASLAAIHSGKSIDTTMGFTPLDGLMMGTRSGSVDPAILIYLMRHGGYDADRLNHLLNEESGLKGISGISGDMREIQTAMDRGDARAQLAFAIYTHRLCREIGGMAASLGGMDTLIFAAGVGENSPPLRAAVCERLAFLGIQIDAAKNEKPAPDSDIAAAGSRVRVFVIHTEEDWAIACECLRVCNT